MPIPRKVCRCLFPLWGNQSERQLFFFFLNAFVTSADFVSSVAWVSTVCCDSTCSVMSSAIPKLRSRSGWGSTHHAEHNEEKKSIDAWLKPVGRGGSSPKNVIFRCRTPPCKSVTEWFRVITFPGWLPTDAYAAAHLKGTKSWIEKKWREEKE